MAGGSLLLGGGTMLTKTGLGYSRARTGLWYPLVRPGLRDFSGQNWGTPWPGLGEFPGQDWGTPSQPGLGYLSPGQNRRASTYYTAGGMPLAFTQEGFLVFLNVYLFSTKSECVLRIAFFKILSMFGVKMSVNKIIFHFKQKSEVFSRNLLWMFTFIFYMTCQNLPLCAICRVLFFIKSSPVKWWKTTDRKKIVDWVLEDQATLYKWVTANPSTFFTCGMISTFYHDIAPIPVLTISTKPHSIFLDQKQQFGKIFFYVCANLWLKIQNTSTLRSDLTIF